jgi:hypothetical protein
MVFNFQKSTFWPNFHQIYYNTSNLIFNFLPWCFHKMIYNIKILKKIRRSTNMFDKNNWKTWMFVNNTMCQFLSSTWLTQLMFICNNTFVSMSNCFNKFIKHQMKSSRSSYSFITCSKWLFVIHHLLLIFGNEFHIMIWTW